MVTPNPDEHREYWSKVAPRYDRVVDLQIGPKTRAMVRERVAKEGRLGTEAIRHTCAASHRWCIFPRPEIGVYTT
jgi:hypothetical protein